MPRYRIVPKAVVFMSKRDMMVSVDDFGRRSVGSTQYVGKNEIDGWMNE